MGEVKISQKEYEQCKEMAMDEVRKDFAKWLGIGYITVAVPPDFEMPSTLNESNCDTATYRTMTFRVIRTWIPVNPRELNATVEWVG